MKNLFEIDEWKVIERKFDPQRQEEAESIFSIGNGSFGQRANFEETYTGKSLQGSYVGPLEENEQGREKQEHQHTFHPERRRVSAQPHDIDDQKPHPLLTGRPPQMDHTRLRASHVGRMEPAP